MDGIIRKTCQKAKSLIPVPLKKKIRNYIQYRDTLKQLNIKYSNGRFILMATPEHGNLGDHAIAEAEHHFLSDYFPDRQVCEVTGNCFRLMKKEIMEKIHHKDILFISGGGFLGSLWLNEEELVREIIHSFPENKIIVFPQTIFFENNEHGDQQFRESGKVFSGHRQLLISVRDKASRIVAEKLIGDSCKQPVLFAPDIVSYHPPLEEVKGPVSSREGILACLRKDKEKVVSEEVHLILSRIAEENNCSLQYTDTVIEDRITPGTRSKYIREKLGEFYTARLVITDRLHGMLFAAITDTPCIAMDNSSGKVAGVYEWISHLDYVRLAADFNELQSISMELLQQTSNSYDFEKLKPVFDDLASNICKFVTGKDGEKGNPAEGEQS